MCLFYAGKECVGYTGIMKRSILAGTYTGKGSEGIYRFTENNGTLDCCGLFYRIPNPKYLAKEGNWIAAAADFDAGSGIALFDAQGNLCDTAVYEKETSCYITIQDGAIYTANYHGGTFTRAMIRDGKITDVQTVLIQEKGGCHQVMVYGDHILVPCLLMDRIMIYDRELKKCGEIVFAKGTGPRHGVFSKDGNYLYLASELSNEFFVIETKTWKIVTQMPALLDGRMHVTGGAAVRMSDDGRHVYVSTREVEMLSVFEVDGERAKLVQNVSCGGSHPRDFILAGDHLLCANRFTNDVVSFALHEDGTIGEAVSRITVPEAVSLLVIEEYEN